jgi:RecB family endonuclease NucS
VEPGLRLYQKGDQKAVEFPVDDGRIDILALDTAGRFVVFELKLARGRNKALGQLLYYMGWVDKHLGKGPCRGIIVAKEITDDLVLAVQRVQDVALFRYTLSVSVERVS